MNNSSCRHFLVNYRMWRGRCFAFVWSLDLTFRPPFSICDIAGQTCSRYGLTLLVDQCLYVPLACGQRASVAAHWLPVISTGLHRLPATIPLQLLLFQFASLQSHTGQWSVNLSYSWFAADSRYPGRTKVPTGARHLRRAPGPSRQVLGSTDSEVSYSKLMESN